MVNLQHIRIKKSHHILNMLLHYLVKYECLKYVL